MYKSVCTYKLNPRSKKEKKTESRGQVLVQAIFKPCTSLSELNMKGKKRNPKETMYLVLWTTSRDHACASWGRSRSCSSTSYTSTTSPSRYGTPRCLHIRGLALPLINQASHALIRFLGRRRRRRLFTRRDVDRRDGASRDWPHRNIESTESTESASVTAGSGSGIRLNRRATSATIRRRRLPLHREAWKTDRGRSAFCAQRFVQRRRNAEARRRLLRRVRRESG